MPTVKIDNVDYDTDNLSNEAKAQLVSMQFCDQELARLQAQAAAYQIASWPMPKPCNLRCPWPLLAIRLNSTDALHRGRLLGRIGPNPSTLDRTH